MIMIRSMMCKLGMLGHILSSNTWCQTLEKDHNKLERSLKSSVCHYICWLTESREETSINKSMNTVLSPLKIQIRMP